MKISIVLLSAVSAVAAQSTFTATGVGCEPHNDHWHCPAGVAEPTTPPAAQATSDTVVATASGVCEPHNDHWHCPEGVAEPTTPPPTSAAAATTPAISKSASHSHDDDDHDHSHEITASTCQPHGDHWHCPSGVAEPTTAPAQSAASGSTVATTTRSGASSASGTAAQQSTAAAAAMGVTQQGVTAALLGAFGALFL